MLKEELLNSLTEKQRKYDYSLVPNKFKCNDKLSIICHCHDILGNEHGLFVSNGGHLKRGDGCPKCNGKYMTKELFVAQANKIHGNGTYNYDKFFLTTKKAKSIIHCNKHNIDFEQSANKHLLGHGCPKCRYEKSAQSKTHNNEWFINKARKIHGDKYDYSKVNYINSSTKVCIICPEHGEFWQTPENHLHKTFPQGCPKCAREKTISYRRSNTNDFIKKAKIKHNNKYVYDKVVYRKNSEKVCIVCPVHGEFWQEPTNHLQGQGCPICNNSHIEEEIRQFLQVNNIIFEEQKTFDWLKHKNKLRLDFYLPDYNIAIECQGQQHFKDVYFDGKTSLLEENIKRDQIKRDLCEEHGLKIYYYANYEYDFPYFVYTDKEKMLKQIFK